MCFDVPTLSVLLLMYGIVLSERQYSLESCTEVYFFLARQDVIMYSCTGEKGSESSDKLKSRGCVRHLCVSSDWYWIPLTYTINNFDYHYESRRDWFWFEQCNVDFCTFLHTYIAEYVWGKKYVQRFAGLLHRSKMFSFQHAFWPLSLTNSTSMVRWSILTDT
jgi:hypothetical protein